MYGFGKDLQIPWDIAMVWPMQGPTARIPTIDYTRAADGTSLADSAQFDSTDADQTEAATKTQIAFCMTTRDITAIDRALYFDLSGLPGER